MDSEALSQFVSLTNSTPDAAKFFLESANGDVEAAIDQYFASGGQAQQEESVPAAVEQHQAAAATAITPATVAAAASAPAKKPAAGEQATRLIRSLGRLDLAMLGKPCQGCAVVMTKFGRAVAMVLQAKPRGQLEVYVVWLMLLGMHRTQMKMMMKAMSTMQEDRRGKACSLPSVINTCHMPTKSNASYSGQVVKGAPKNKVCQLQL